MLRKIYSLIFNSSKPEICADIRVPALKCNWAMREVHPVLGDELFLKLKGDPYFQRDFQTNLEYHRGQFLVEIPWGRVRDRIGYVFLPDGSVCSEANWCRDYMKTNFSYTNRFRRKKKIGGDVFTLLGLWSDAYYHWFHDTLPRLSNSLPWLPDNCRFLIQSCPKDYQLESLLALGIEKHRLVFQHDRGDTLVERLWFSTPHGYTTFGGTQAIERIAQKIKAHCLGNMPRVSSKDRVFISRSKAPSRRILNEEMLLPILQEHGFRCEVLESHPFHKQVQIVSECDILLGPHGAGLANLIFMPRNGKVIEIAGPEVVNCYGFMTQDSGRVFARFLAQQDGRNGDYTVDPVKFNDFIIYHCGHR
jgi:hypothetical protein